MTQVSSPQPTTRNARYDLEGSAAAPASEPARLSAPNVGDVRSLLVELEELLQKMGEGSMSAKAAEVDRYHQLAERSIQDAFQAQKRANDAERSKGGLLSDLEKACGDVLGDVAHLRFADAVRDLKEDTVNDPQFWKDLAKTGASVAKWAAVAGSIVLAAGLTATGAGAPVAVALAIGAAALTTAGAAESELGVLEKMGVDAKTAQWVGVGLSVGGAAAGAGAGLAVAATAGQAQAANAAASASTSAGGSAGDCAAGASVQAARNAQQLSAEIGGGVDAAAAASGVAGGVGKMGVAYYEKQALEAKGDAEAASQKEQFFRRLLEAVEKAIGDTYADAAKATAALHDSMLKQNQVMLAVSATRV